MHDRREFLGLAGVGGSGLLLRACAAGDAPLGAESSWLTPRRSMWSWPTEKRRRVRCYR